MAPTIDEAASIFRDDGLIELVKRSVRFLYDNRIRPQLPKRIVPYNGISVRAARLGDSIIPWQTREIPGYEDGLINGIRQYVKDGDTVVAVGGGLGVSSVAAATQAGDDGLVIVYEGGASAVRNVNNTVKINHVEDQIEIRHAIVGQAIMLRGDQDGANIVPATDLPDCDVLVLDCEGAELGIIENLEIQPRTMIVETHGVYDAPETEVRSRLNRAGYETVNSMIAETRLRETCKQKGINVLFSIRREDLSDATPSTD